MKTIRVSTNPLSHNLPFHPSLVNLIICKENKLKLKFTHILSSLTRKSKSAHDSTDCHYSRLPAALIVILLPENLVSKSIHNVE